MSNLFAGLIAGIISSIMIPCIIFTASRHGWFDTINPRKIHKREIPRLGGIGIFWAFLLTLVFRLLISKSFAEIMTEYWPVIGAMVLVHLIGLVDDFKDLNALIKFLMHCLAALVVVTFGFRFKTIYLPVWGVIELGWLSFVITPLWIVGVINAINMIDGLDGLSGGISIIAAFAFGLIFLETNNVFPAFLCIALVGSLVGYLFYNFPPAKIFMGDSGSTFLGFTLAIFPLLDRSGGNGFCLLNGITILLLPVFDVFAAIFRRIKQRVSPLTADSWHFHHKLLKMGLGNRAILAIAYTICMILAAVAISGLLFSALIHFITTITAWLMLLSLFIALHYAKENILEAEKINNGN
jgi:UDP-GlcNAc:undecaprenyl-phosphate GlcNAc-1-phosphate transferase